MTRRLLSRMGWIGEVPYYPYKGVTVVALDEIPEEDLTGFVDWMRGSPMPVFPELGTVFYAEDYERWRMGLPNND